MKDKIKVNDKTEWFAEELRLAELHEDFMSKYAIECRDNKGAEWYSWKDSDSPQDIWETWIEPKLKQVKVEPEVGMPSETLSCEQNRLFLKILDNKIKNAEKINKIGTINNIKLSELLIQELQNLKFNFNEIFASKP